MITKMIIVKAVFLKMIKIYFIEPIVDTSYDLTAVNDNNSSIYTA